MQTQATQHSANARRANPKPQQFLPLELENRPRVATDQAAYYLSRAPQTLRAWACMEHGPLRPIRIHGRLAWSTADIRRVLGVSA